jgi:hypothetical protein
MAHVLKPSVHNPQPHMHGLLQQSAARALPRSAFNMPAKSGEPLPVFDLQPYLNGRAACAEVMHAQLTLCCALIQTDRVHDKSASVQVMRLAGGSWQRALQCACMKRAPAWCVIRVCSPGITYLVGVHHALC